MLIEVALPLPLPRTFTYRSPSAAVPVGSRVLVPFRSRQQIGWVVGTDAVAPENGDVRDLTRVLDAEPSVPEELLALCRWVADYYIAPLGQVLRTALPAVLSDTAKPEPAVKRRSILRLTRALPSLQQRDELFARAPRQRECYEVVEGMGGEAEAAVLTGQAGFSPGVLRGLVAKGVAEIVAEEVARDPFAGDAPVESPDIRPTPAQSAVLERLRAARNAPVPKPMLLQGVTGSGKTLVYIELLEDVVRRDGRGAIVLVPEIALTPQTVARFRARFGEDVAVLHSGLSDGERYDAWRALREGRRRIAVGARSAIFAPVRDLGAIIVDEEHEASYKQADSPRYHARDVAVVRARLAGAVCVLGSATPALESWHNASTGKFELLELPDRVAGRALPPVEIVDLRALRDRGGVPEQGRPGRQIATGASGGDSILSPGLTAAIHSRLARGEQTILLLNRRGYAAFVQCRTCGQVRQCPQCSVSLTYHRTRRRMVCHHCFHVEPVPGTCDACGGTELRYRGIGTEQVERTISDAFPAARIARMDVDTTGGKWAHHRILDRVGRGEVDILLGTQMIAKGLDFPTVTLVGVINADIGLNLPDFRATERTFQLLTQVAGRAGRGPRGGKVVIQTSLPEHYALQTAVAHDFVGFSERELQERAETGYPPYVRLANIVVSGTDERLVQDATSAAAGWARAWVEASGAGLRVTGPAPCPIDRLRGRWRWHFLLRARRPHEIGELCHALLADYPLKPGRAGLRLAIDRDPVALL